jgi:ATP-binding protein involved in chromosome partitioning
LEEQGGNGVSDGCNEMIGCNLCAKQQACGLDQAEHGARLVRQRLEAVGRCVLVLSNKGGVGKSTVAANLAAALAGRGLRVGLADADLTGPSVPHLFGLRQARVRMGEHGLVPPQPRPELSLKLFSIGFLLPDADTPVLWRDSFKYEFLQQLVGGVDWGELDLLLVDMPPGTGGELIGLAELVGRADGAVIVTTPQELALSDVRKAVAAVREMEIPVLGLVENMAGLVCPHCDEAIYPFKGGGGSALAGELGIALLGSVPFDMAAMGLADDGAPVVLAAPTSPAALALERVAAALQERLAPVGR